MIVDRALGVAAYYALVSGPLLILTVIFNPVGISGRVRRHLGAAAPPMAAGRRGATTPAPSSARLPVATGAAPARVIGDVLLRGRRDHRDLRRAAGGRPAQPGRAGRRDRRPDRAQRRRQDELHRRRHRVHAVHGPGAPARRAARRQRRPASRARSGLVRTWQSVELFDDLSVEDNVRVSDDVGHDAWKMLRDAVRPNAPPSPAVGEAIALVGLEHAARPQALRAPARPPEAGRRGSVARAAAEGAAARRAGGRARRRRDRRLRAAPRPRSPPPASAACSSTTTCASCSACATACT